MSAARRPIAHSELLDPLHAVDPSSAAAQTGRLTSPGTALEAVRPIRCDEGRKYCAGRTHPRQISLATGAAKHCAVYSVVILARHLEKRMPAGTAAPRLLRPPASWFLNDNTHLHLIAGHVVCELLNPHWVRAAQTRPLQTEADMRFLAICMAVGAFLVAGCNTIEGAGKDIERGGEKVQDSAESVKRKM